MTKKGARRLAAELPVKGDFKDFGAMSAVSVVLPADRGSLAVTVGDTRYRTECRYKTDTAKRCQVLLLLFQAGSKWAKEGSGGGPGPGFTKPGTFVFMPSLFRSAEGTERQEGY